MTIEVDEPVAWRVKRYGEKASGHMDWSEWMLFPYKTLIGPWKHPENMIIEPLYTRGPIDVTDSNSFRQGL